jgi:hypothetical protein
MDTSSSSSSSKEEKKTADADEIIVDIESHISQNQITRKRLFLIIASYGTSPSYPSFNYYFNIP